MAYQLGNFGEIVVLGVHSIDWNADSVADGNQHLGSTVEVNRMTASPAKLQLRDNILSTIQHKLSQIHVALLITTVGYTYQP